MGEKSQPPGDKKKPVPIQLQIDDAVAQGTYANLALISHTENEFVLDFVFVQPTRTGAKVQSRIVLAPRQAKRLAATLSDAVGRFEERFGEITLPQGGGDDGMGKLVH